MELKVIAHADRNGAGGADRVQLSQVKGELGLALSGGEERGVSTRLTSGLARWFVVVSLGGVGWTGSSYVERAR